MNVTPSQAAILELLAEGDTTAEIAEKRGIRVHTVREHLKQIKRRVGARTTHQLVAMYVRG